ncbi:hypothetical protein ASD8599_01062 [Ascidiaceihabitans donghaensis]|uniref:Uncharacterized protein n=1 Tax=Ascidiaceihabitans donghaensis TaxID=1510460 RepID=A0A2R8BBN8_9RHOB|nr:hypothetical protein [Ascidiaceihabitans donghaensis]SPH20326.1 hypothetical protein ASD8599_01062 [Ascidiaceihabitans donghaensis]
MKFETTPSFESYFDLAEASTQMALSSHSDAMRILEQIHTVFVTELPLISDGWGPSQGLLNISSLMTWLTSIRVATTGHSASAFPLFRTSLEAACYAYNIWAQPELEQVWLERNRDDKAHRKSRRAFTSAVKDAAKHLVKRSFVWPGTEDWINTAYNQSIDFGAHPNPKSILPGVRIDDQRTDGMVGLNLAGVYGGDSFEAERLLVASIDYGQLILLVAGCGTEQPSQNIFDSLNLINDSKEKYVADRFS